jgi:hypothetical protein
MSVEPIYSDKLVSITDDQIIFKDYYYPSGKEKIVRFDNIENIVVKKPTIWNGRWRLHGTGNFKTWYPMDSDRHRRDRIFIATLKDQWINIGFTVEDGERVENILREKHLIE